MSSPPPRPRAPRTAARPDPDREVDWEGVRLHIVTGKGGTGKTTVAAALALALAAGGKRTLVCEVEGRQSLAQVFDVPPLPFEETPVALAPHGGDVLALAVDAEQALLEYLELFYRLGRAGKGLKKIGAVDFATTIAPGLRDVLLTGKVYEAVGRTRGGTGRRRGTEPVYDAVVLDAPPTGRIAKFLNINHEVAGLARIGPIHHQADSIMRLLTSPQTVIHLVTVLEEMPVQETVDGVAELTDLGLPVGAVIVNMVRESRLRAKELVAASRGSLDRDAVAASLTQAGVRTADHPVILDALLEEAADHAERVDLEKRGRAVLTDLAHPTYELPLIPDGIDLGSLYRLAESLTGQGAA